MPKVFHERPDSGVTRAVFMEGLIIRTMVWNFWWSSAIRTGPCSSLPTPPLSLRANQLPLAPVHILVLVLGCRVLVGLCELLSLRYKACEDLTRRGCEGYAHMRSLPAGSMRFGAEWLYPPKWGSWWHLFWRASLCKLCRERFLYVGQASGSAVPGWGGWGHLQNLTKLTYSAIRKCVPKSCGQVLSTCFLDMTSHHRITTTHRDF